MTDEIKEPIETLPDAEAERLYTAIHTLLVDVPPADAITALLNSAALRTSAIALEPRMFVAGAFHAIASLINWDAAKAGPMDLLQLVVRQVVSDLAENGDKRAMAVQAAERIRPAKA